MKRITRHLRVGMVVIVAVLIGVFPVYTSAAVAPVLTLTTVPDVFITEIQTNGGSAAQEFIEFYNATDQDIHFSDPVTGSAQWKLQFFNSTAVKSGTPTWATSATASNTVTLEGTISAHDYFVLSSTGYAPGGIEPDQTYAASSSHLMTDTGGGLQLLSISATETPVTSMVHDRIMWLAQVAGVMLPTGVLATPTTGNSLQRLPNDNTEYVEIDDTLTEFGSADTVSPLDVWQAPAPVVPIVTSETSTEDSNSPAEPASDETLTGTDTSASVVRVDNTGLEAPRITELLPNPASPKTDAADEFIELYNPNASPFYLKGYVLEVGTTTLHDFAITDSVVIPANGYLAFYSVDTRLSLANSGGQARLLDLSGAKVTETMPYATAADDNSWNLIDGSWMWSTTPTPSAQNTITSTLPTAKAATVAKAATAARAAKVATTKTASAKTKGTTTAKKAIAKKSVAKKKTTKKKAVTKKTTALTNAAAVKPKPPIHAGILVAVAIAALLYGLYEYRHDISNKFAQLRGNRATRRGSRGQAEWRRGYSTQ